MTGASRTVWFHRRYERLTGGHVKHAQYYQHVACLPGHMRRIVFGVEPRDPRLAEQQASLWPTAAEERTDLWDPGRRDILFLAGTDWRYFAQAGVESVDIPRLNLIQHVRHAFADTELHGYLDKPAVRICVSEEVAQAIRATGRVNGPVFTIPNGTDCSPSPVDCRGTGGFDERPETITIVGYKRPDLATELSRRLHEEGIPHLNLDGFLDRSAFLGLLERTRVAVCLPRSEEGFYLPALEAMAAGCTVVTLDCIGNRGFCRDGHNCVVAEADAASLARTVMAVVDLPTADRHRLHTHASATAYEHSLEAERTRFHELLLDIDRLWKDAAASPPRGPRLETARANARLVDFMIVGAQKSGTTALAHFLSQHPAVAMAPREGHLFDSPDYSSNWTPAEIDARYVCRIESQPGTAVSGESTPIYLFLPDVASELRRYNPALKVIAILRDPVERAVSHYAMERGRGKEHRSFGFALLVEWWRLRRCTDPRAPESAARRHSYRSRGLYSVQLRKLFAAFPRDQVLILRTEDLLHNHDETLTKVFAFLGVSVSVRIPPEMVFKGADFGGTHACTRGLLRLSYLAESRRMRTVLAVRGENARPGGHLGNRA